MSPEIYGILGFVALFAFLAMGAPVAIALLVVGFVGTILLSGFQAAAFTLSGQVFATVTVYELTIIPLFILMGNLASAAGLSRDLFEAAHKMIGRFKGGRFGRSHDCRLRGGFAALSGSSIASAITMGKVAYPEMRRYNYGGQTGHWVHCGRGHIGHPYSAFNRLCHLCGADRRIDWPSVYGRCFARHFVDDNVSCCHRSGDLLLA